MDILVRWMCDCGAPRWACPECRGKGMVVRWIPVEVLSLLEKPYVILSRRFARAPERAAS
jgi:hypothetical protein